MKTRNHFTWVLLAVTALLSSCHKEDENEGLSVSQTYLNFATEGGTQTVTVQSAAGWTVIERPDWVQLSAQSGTGTTELSVTAEANNATAEREGKLALRASDASTTAIVTIHQEAQGQGTSFLRVVQSEVFISGLGGYTDSISIESNTRWKISGPSWLAVKDPNRGTINLSNGYEGEGNKTVVLLTMDTNTDNADRVTTISISAVGGSQQTTVAPQQVKVTLLGRLSIKICDVFALADGIAFSVKRGAEAAGFYWNVVQGSATGQALTIDDYWTLSNAGENYYYSWEGLQGNTLYDIVAYGVTSDESETNETPHICTVRTPSEGKQPLAHIGTGSREDGKWKLQVQMNSLAKSYYVGFRQIEDYYYWNSAISWAYQLKLWLKEGYEPKSSDKANDTWSVTTNSDICFFTWAKGADGQLSNVVSTRECWLEESDNAREHLLTVRRRGQQHEKIIHP